MKKLHLLHLRQFRRHRCHSHQLPQRHPTNPDTTRTVYLYTLLERPSPIINTYPCEFLFHVQPDYHHLVHTTIHEYMKY